MILSLCTLVALTDKPNVNIQTEYTRIIARNGSIVRVYRCPSQIDPKTQYISTERPLREIRGIK